MSDYQDNLQKLIADLRIGMEMQVAVEPLYRDDDGVERTVYAWRIA